jgi:hypothetical protein
MRSSATLHHRQARWNGPNVMRDAIITGPEDVIHHDRMTGGRSAATGARPGR